MARGRMIDKRVSMSKKLGIVSDKAKVIWFIIYPHLDRKGRIAFDNLEDLKDEIIPKFKNWPLKKVADALNEIAEIGLIDLYPFIEKIAMEFKRFEDFQTIREDREASSKIIAPGKTPESSGVFRITPALRLMLSLKKEAKGKKYNKVNVENTFEIEFENLWKAWPKEARFNKQYAKGIFFARCEEGLLSLIQKCFRGYMEFLRYKKIHENFEQKPMYLSTFLNKKRYLEYEKFKCPTPM